MRWISYAIMMVFIVSMGVTPVFAQTSQQFTIQDAPSGKSYDVNYSITGATVDDMYISPQDTSLIVSLKSSGDGQLTLTMPRSLIDAKVGGSDDQFFVLVDGVDTDFTESKTTTDRTISVLFPGDTLQIEVIGTNVVPEFGGMSFVVLMVAIVSIVAISAKTRLKF